MSKEKQIEERSCTKCLHYCACLRNSEYYPERPCFAYEDKAGYRKQSDDVVEIVRCKDCAVPHNTWTGCPKLNGLVTPPDFFCALAEPKMKGGE